MQHPIDQIEAYIAGGLTPGERAEFEAHIAGCPACAAALKEATDMDAAMNNMFSLARPAPGFEDRLVQRLRRFPKRRLRIHPLVAKVAAGVAAGIMLAGVGYVGNRFLNTQSSLTRTYSITDLNRWIPDFTDAPSFDLRSLPNPAAPLELHYKDAPADQVLADVSKKLGVEVVKHRPIEGRVTVETDQPANSKEALVTLNTALKSVGYTAVPQNGMLRVVPRDTAASQNLPIHFGYDLGRIPATDEMITQIIPVKNIDAGRLRQQLAPALAGTTVSNAGSNTMIITDSASNVRRIVGEVEKLDHQSAGEKDRAVADITRSAQASIGEAYKVTSLGLEDRLQRGDSDRRSASFGRSLSTVGPTVPGLAAAGANRPNVATGVVAFDAFAKDNSDGILLPTDNKEGIPPVAAPAKPAIALQLGELTRQRDLAEHSYFSLAVPAQQEKELADLRAGVEGKGIVLGGRNPTSESLGFGRQAGEARAMGRIDTLGDKVTLNYAAVTTDDLAKKGTAAGDKPVGQIVAQLKPDQAEQTTPSGTNGEPKPATETPPAPTIPPPQTAPQPPVSTGSKIIRNGDMEFEVDSFDSSVMQIGKIAAEEGGYVSTTESDKLPNGKVKGRVVLRCPPERLDTLVLKLRGIGDLRTQRIGAQDVTKQYTDTESALRAAHAMQERLLDIIKNGKGAVKDLLEAEKQLGVWREKIEQLEGEIRYFNSLISLSTLSVTLYERDIKNPAFANETETVAMSLETEKVEDDYQKARDAIAEAKGRITASELKQFDAGQYRATISALLPPDAAEALIARVRQLDGRFAHFERQRSQSTTTGDVGRADPLRIKRDDVIINLTIYNLANIAPRRTTTLLIVAPNVEEAYRNLIDQVNSAGGRVVTSTISRPRPDQTAGSINFNVPADKADVILAAIRGAGEVLKTDTSETPDTQNVTESKRGFSVTVSSLAAFAARETHQVQLAAGQVPEAFNEVLNAVRTKDGRIINSQLNEQDSQNVVGTIDFEVPRDSIGTVEQAMHHSSEVVSRVVTRSTDTENTVDNKIHITLTVSSADRLQARETMQTQLAAASVVDSFAAIRAGVPKGGRILASELNEQDPQNVSAHLIFDLPQSAEPAMNELLKKNTAVLSRQVRRVPEGQIAVEKLRVELTLVSADQQSPREMIHLGVQVTDVQKAGEDVVAAALSAGGRQSESPSVSQDPSGHSTSTITVDVPADKSQSILDQIDRMGNRRTRQVSLNTQVPDSPLARARIEVTFSDSAASLGGTESMGDYLRNGLLTSLKGLGYSLMWITIGICLIAPWALLIWAGWKLIRRSRNAKIAAPGAPA